MAAGFVPSAPEHQDPPSALARTLLLPLIVYAAAGLILSLAVHLLSFFGLQPGGTTLFEVLHIGIFPLWLPVVFVASKRSSGARRKDFWKAALAGCPTWMRYMTYGFFAYAILNFVLFLVVAPTGRQLGGAPPSSVWHGFSGHWMAFYSAGLAIVTSAYRGGFATPGAKCPNGHTVGFGDRFCGTCGTPVDTHGG
jgi:hypothetical protein